MKQTIKIASISTVVLLLGLFSSCGENEPKCWKESYLGDSVRDFVFYDIWGSSGNNIFAVGECDAVHFDGNEWKKLPDAYNCRGVWGSSESDVYAVYLHIRILNMILRYNGEEWSDTGAEFRGRSMDIWGSSGDDVYVVGYYQESAPGFSESIIVHYDGEQWTETQTGCRAILESVWGTSSNNIYAVGHVGVLGGTILHYDGSTWNIELEGLPHSLYSVWGFSEDDVYAVGGGGHILHFDGNDWTEIESGTVARLYSVWGAEEDAVFIGGAGILRLYNGETMKDVMEIKNFVVNSIWGTSTDNVFIAGFQHVDYYPVPIILRSTCTKEELIQLNK